MCKRRKEGGTERRAMTTRQLWRRLSTSLWQSQLSLILPLRVTLGGRGTGITASTTRTRSLTATRGSASAGVTANFARELFGWYSAFNDFYDYGGKLNAPILIQQAMEDTTVLPEHVDWCDKALSKSKFTKYEGSRYNIWWEQD